MKVIVVGIDGLEYKHVVKYGPQNLTLIQYGKTDLSDFDLVVTPLIWSSFLTGKTNKSMINTFVKSYKFRRTLLWSVARTSIKKIKSLLPISIRRPLDELTIKITTNPMRRTSSYLKDNNIKTILEEFDSWYITIPGYNQEWDTYSSLLMSRAVEEFTKTGKFGKACTEYEKYTINDYLKRKKVFLKSLKENHQFWFFYTDLIDALLHLFISDRLRIMRYYYEVDKFVGKVCKLAPSDAVIFVISDHGMMQKGRLGNHSSYGFWSSSIYINNFYSPKPTDFYYLWKKILEKNLNNKS